jgi:hypothetical protein
MFPAGRSNNYLDTTKLENAADHLGKIPFSCTHTGQGHHNHTPKSYKSLMTTVTGMRLPDIHTAVREAMIVARKTLEEKGLSSISLSSGSFYRALICVNPGTQD